MDLTLLAVQNLSHFWLVVAFALLCMVIMAGFTIVFANRYIKAGPSQVLIISGRKQGGRNFRIVKGHGSFVFPIVEKYDVMSLEALNVDIKAARMQCRGGTVEIDAAAQVKIKDGDDAIAAAAEHFLSMTRRETAEVVRLALESQLRTVAGALPAEEISQNHSALAQRVQATAADGLVGMGLALLSFTIRDVKVVSGPQQN